MTIHKSCVWVGFLVASLLFELGAKAQVVRRINTASGILVNNGTSTGGPTANLSIASGGITNSSLANSSVTVSSGTGLSGGGPVSLGGSVTLGIDTSVVPLLGSANNFTATQTISSGNLALPGTSSSTSGVITLGGAAFLHGYGRGNFFAGNTFVGPNAGNFTMSGNVLNTGVGFETLASSTTGSFNTSSGYRALFSNTTGSYNTASGSGGTLYLNTTGSANTAIGAEALYFNTTGSWNNAFGAGALFANTTGTNNIAIGNGAGSINATGSWNIDIANDGGAGESGVIRIGTTIHTSTFIAGISGVTTGGTGTTVLVDSNGQLGTVSSSRRLKDDIQDMGEASSGLWKLRPVTFRYKRAQNDGSRPLQYGLIAEEVADVYPGLVQFDSTGQPNAVLYHALPALLLNEAKKQHQQIEELKAENGALREQVAKFKEEETEIRQLRAEIERLRAAIEQQLAAVASVLK